MKVIISATVKVADLGLGQSQNSYFIIILFEKSKKQKQFFLPE
jgi:hypothetical protein